MPEFKLQETKNVFDTVTRGASPIATLFWEHFLHLVEIPRPSHHPEQVVPYLVSLAGQNGWESTVDSVNNVLIKVPASAGLESAPTVCLQGHTDIVPAVAAGTSHDHTKDIIKTRIVDNEWVGATGTSLGGDNGVGVASALAVALSKDVKHGPLELLFTSDEEVGLIGATGLEPDRLAARFLVNIDSEEEGSITIGCAGGLNARVQFDIQREPVPFEHKVVKVDLDGLRGGHTGVEIHTGRLSGIRAFGRAMRQPINAGIGFRLFNVQGGFAHNAICNKLVAEFAVEAEHVEAFRKGVQEEFEAAFSEYRATDPNARVDISVGDAAESKWEPMSDIDTKRVCNYALAGLFGPQQYSHTVEGLVETSFSTTKVSTEAESVEYLGSARSSVETALTATYERVAAIAEAFGARILPAEDRYPAWEPQPDAEMVKTAARVYREVAGAEAEVTAIHAGLECGVICSKYPGMQSLSIGPNLKEVHSPDEKLHVASTGRTLEYLAKLVAELAKIE